MPTKSLFWLGMVQFPHPTHSIWAPSNTFHSFFQNMVLHQWARPTAVTPFSKKDEPFGSASSQTSEPALCTLPRTLKEPLWSEEQNLFSGDLISNPILPSPTQPNPSFLLPPPMPQSSNPTTQTRWHHIRFKLTTQPQKERFNTQKNPQNNKTHTQKAVFPKDAVEQVWRGVLGRVQGCISALTPGCRGKRQQGCAFQPQAERGETPRK